MAPPVIERDEPGGGIAAVLVVVPARDEEEHLAATVRALAEAADRLPVSVEVSLVLVLDACADATPAVARRAAAGFRWRLRRRSARSRAEVLDRSIDCSSIPNVGAARHDGVLRAMGSSAGRSAATWIATTDADTIVPADWLVQQLAVAAAGVAAVAGCVTVLDWSPWPEGVAVAWSDSYHHGGRRAPVHGANLGVRLDRYLQVGGFAALVDGEDQDLFDRVRAAGLPTAVTTAAPVVTSSRRHGRAPAGFSGYLRDLETVTGNPA